MKTARKDRRLLVARLMILGLATGIIAGLWTLWKNDFFEDSGWFWPVLGGMFLLGLIPLFGLLAKHRHRGALVLWCRRFSTADLEVGKRNRWIWAVITEACRDLAIPITLRDRSLAGSQSVGRSLQTPLSVLLILLGIPLWLWGMLFVLDFVDGSWPEFAVCAGGFVLYIVMFRLIGSLVETLTRTMATFDGNPSAIKKRLEVIRKRGISRRELDAIRCTDENWQDCVLAVLQSVDFVIIDNVDSSENIDWEIEQSISHVGAERVFMLLGQGTEAFPGVTSIFFNFDRAEQEIESLQSAWGEDDFGEATAIGETGQKLAQILRKKMESQTGGLDK